MSLRGLFIMHCVCIYKGLFFYLEYAEGMVMNASTKPLGTCFCVYLCKVQSSFTNFVRVRNIQVALPLFITVKMVVLGRVPVNVFIHFGVLVFLGTILLCYILAVSLHHVPAWLPMISDCAVQAPEKYPFRWGFMVGSTLLGAESVIIYGADKPYSKSKLALVMGVLASFGLSVVGVVNEDEDNLIHSSKDAVFYVCIY